MTLTSNTSESTRGSFRFRPYLPHHHQLPYFVSKNPRLQFLQIRQVLSLLPVMMVSPS